MAAIERRHGDSRRWYGGRGSKGMACGRRGAALQESARARVEQARRDEMEGGGDGCALEDRLARVSSLLPAHSLMGGRVRSEGMEHAAKTGEEFLDYL